MASKIAECARPNILIFARFKASANGSLNPRGKLRYQKKQYELKSLKLILHSCQ